MMYMYNTRHEELVSVDIVLYMRKKCGENTSYRSEAIFRWRCVPPQDPYPYSIAKWDCYRMSLSCIQHCSRSAIAVVFSQMFSWPFCNTRDDCNIFIEQAYAFTLCIKESLHFVKIFTNGITRRPNIIIKTRTTLIFVLINSIYSFSIGSPSAMCNFFFLMISE